MFSQRGTDLAKKYWGVDAEEGARPRGRAPSKTPTAGRAKEIGVPVPVPGYRTGRWYDTR
ncbi:hypothetical protein GCM10018987_64150 [Streptomyces cremeus]